MAYAPVFEPRKTVRIIAFSVANAKLHMGTVNVSTTKATAHEYPEFLQATGDTLHATPTVMAAAALTTGIPTIYVNGYSGPE